VPVHVVVIAVRAASSRSQSSGKMAVSASPVAARIGQVHNTALIV
jgi:hypothetical protein